MLQLRRIISSESWVPEIDGLRCVAILGVIFFHIAGEVGSRGLRPLDPLPYLDYLLANADRGVALFFVISGFVLARPFFQQHRGNGRPVRLSSYFLRRLTRLEPPFLLSLTLYFIAFAALRAPLRELIVHTLVSAAYLHNLVFPTTPTVPNYVTWSLEIEVQFYLLAPLLGQLFRIPRTILRRAVWAALTLAGCLWSAFHTSPPITVFSYAGFFPAGFLLADIFESTTHPHGTGRERYLWDVLALIGWSAFVFLPRNDTIRAFLPILIMPLCLTAFHGKLSRAFLRLPLLTTLGGMCYSLYLLHPLVISAFFRLVKYLRLPSDVATYLLQGTLLLTAVIVCGMVYFVLIERPFMKKRFVSPQQS